MTDHTTPLTLTQDERDPEYMAVRARFWDVTIDRTQPPTPVTEATMLAHERTSRMIAAIRRLSKEGEAA